MSGRGRGRGGRGGRGGASGAGHPVAKDDEGKILKTEIEGPPPLFPEAELPEVPSSIPIATERQLMRRHELTSFWKNSPFYLTPPQATSGSKAAGEVERFSDRLRKRQKSERPPLTSILTLDPRYFPEELYSSKQQMAAKSAAAQKAYWAAQQARSKSADAGDEMAIGKLDELAKRENRQKVGGAGAEAGPAGRGDGEGDEPPPEADIEEDEEEMMQDDDYYQNEYFDDDEGYDDGLDDGGDEGPVY